MQRSESAFTDLREHAESLQSLVELMLAEHVAKRPIAWSVDDNVRRVRDALGDPSDLDVRRFAVGNGRQAAVLAIQGIVDQQLLTDFVIEPLLARPARRTPDRLAAARAATVVSLRSAVKRLLGGWAVVFVDGYSVAWTFDMQSIEHRQPEEPTMEPSLRGPREGFVENLQTNLATIRRRMSSPYLRVEVLELGRVSHTRIAMVYVAGRADPGTVAEVRARLQRRRFDAMFSDQQIEGLLQEHTWSLFPQIRATERPDAVLGALHSGRVVVLIDGSPYALIVPSFFWDLLQAPDDYHLRWPFATAIRALRLVGLVLMLGVLPMYVAVVTFHHELIPTEFLLTLAASREGLPLPTLLEALVMNLTFDLLREASTRLPQQVGGALTIVGALVIGEAAVRGGFVSAPMVILIGLGAVSAFVAPAFSTTIPLRVLNYLLLLLAGTMGLVGYSIGTILIVTHLASLRSLGVPFLTPIAPTRPEGWEDVLVRLPWPMQRGAPPLSGEPVSLPRPRAAGGRSR